MSRSLLVVNVHFAPNSFGGATVVAENMAALLAENHGWQVTVITTHQDPAAPPYNLLRYTHGSVDVFSIVVPPDWSLSYEERYDNPRFQQAFADILQRLKLDVAHVHCLQTMGVGVIQELKKRDIPVATTVHDCWWFCEQMFMINSKGRYCHQVRIDPDVCRYCVVEAKKAEIRTAKLHAELEQSDLLLFPSEFQKNLYIANDFPADRCRVNKNGIQMPANAPGPRGQRDKLRLGFVGGPGDNKGSHLIKRALEELEHSNYTLVVVDGAQNRGMSWASAFDW